MPSTSSRPWPWTGILLPPWASFDSQLAALPITLDRQREEGNFQPSAWLTWVRAVGFLQRREWLSWLNLEAPELHVPLIWKLDFSLTFFPKLRVGERRYFKKSEREGETRRELPGIWCVRKLTFSHFYLFINQILLILSSTQTISIFSHFCPLLLLWFKNKEQFSQQNSKNEELSPSFLPLRSITPVHSFRNSYFPYWKKQVKNIIKKCRLSIHWL